MKNKLISSKKLELLIVVVRKNNVDYYIDLLTNFDISLQLDMIASGTTESEIFSDEVDSKSIIFSVVVEDKIKDILKTLDIKFKEMNDGHGVAFTVPLSSLMGVTFFNIITNNTGSII